MRYVVQIPPPSAKRMTKRKLVVEESFGFCGEASIREYPLTKDVVFFEFEAIAQEPFCCDGDSLAVFVKSSNLSGSRIEKVRLEPSAK